MKTLKEYICESSKYYWADLIHTLKTKWDCGCNLDYWCEDVLNTDIFQYKDPDDGQLGDVHAISYILGSKQYIRLSYWGLSYGHRRIREADIDEKTLLDILNRKYSNNSKDHIKGEEYFEKLVQYLKKGWG